MQQHPLFDAVAPALVSGTAILAASIIALTGVVKTVNQKRVDDDRNAWWGRAEWALDKALAQTDREQAIGERIMEELNKQPPTRDDGVLLITALTFIQTADESAGEDEA